MSRKQSATDSGQQAETLAAKYLEQQGLTIITRNYRCRFGEIDLVAREGPVLVFVEVRYRRKPQLMAVTETLGRKKLQRLITTSGAFLGQNRHYQKLQCRYDFMGISGEQSTLEFEWIKNAFQA